MSFGSSGLASTSRLRGLGVGTKALGSSKSYAAQDILQGRAQ